MGINIKSKKSMIGNKVTLEESHLADIEEYIKSLEAKNSQLIKENKDLEVKNAQLIKENEGLEQKFEKRELELEKESGEFIDLALENEGNKELVDYLEVKIEHMSLAIPEADKYNRSYDMLTNYQQKLESSNSSHTYHFDEWDKVKICKYGPEVANEFVTNGKANIPMQREDIEANLYLSGESYERAEGSLNIYTDYKVAVAVTDKESHEVKEYDLYTFEDKYNDDLLHLNNEKSDNQDRENKETKIDQTRNQEVKKMAMTKNMER